MSVEASLICAVFVALLFAGMWVPVVVAAAGIALLLDARGLAGLNGIGLVTWGASNSFTLTAVPLFVLMAELLLRSGIGERLYRGLNRVASGLPGGLLQTNIIGCAVFSAISGSSVATAAAIGTVATPQLKRLGYDARMAYGSLAAGGTLGILIPPSIAFIVYGTFTETSIVALFMAGVVPGLLMALVFMVYIGLRAIADPTLAPAIDAEARDLPWATVAADLLPFSALIFIVLGSLYAGYATPTEAAAVGSVAALAIARVWGRLDGSVLWVALGNAVRTTGSVLFIVVAAYLFSYAVAISGISQALAQWVVGLALGKYMFLALLSAIYVALGCFIESLAMIVITVPLIAPVLKGYGIDPVWFGVCLVILIELGQITPPFGINLFVIQSIAQARFGEVVRGCLPYYALQLGMLLALVAVPGLALWLPSTLR